MKVVICGAGIAGLALAQRLSVLGADVLLVEKAPGPRTQGYMIDFFGPGYDAAEAMGVLPRILELGYRVTEMTYRDDNGRARARMSLARFAKLVHGRFISIMRPDLERALREHLPPRVRLRHGTTLGDIDNRPDGVTVTLSTGETVEADLLVGADGIHSAVRARVFGPEADFLRHLGFHTAAFTFPDARIHARVAGQFCLSETIDRQIGLYGLRDGVVAVFTVHRTADPGLPADPRAALRHEYAGLGWLAPRALAHCPPPDQVYYDQVAQIVMPAWSRDRVVLIGDAAHAVSLLAGQGASLGVTGAYVLGQCLSRADSIDTALRDYQARLRPVVTEKQRVARDATRWFIPASKRHLLIRRAVLKFAHLPVIDRMVATTVVGKPTAVVKREDRVLDGGRRGPGTVPPR